MLPELHIENAIPRTIRFHGRVCLVRDWDRDRTAEHVRSFVAGLSIGALIRRFQVALAFGDNRAALVDADHDGDIQCAPNEHPVLAPDAFDGVTWEVA